MADSIFPRRPRYLGKPDDTLENAIADLHQNSRVLPPVDLPGAPSAENIGRLTAEAVQAQFENAAKSVEEMGPSIKEQAVKLETALQEADGDMKLIVETAAAIRQKGANVLTQVEEWNVISQDIRGICAEFKKKLGT